MSKGFTLMAYSTDDLRVSLPIFFQMMKRSPVSKSCDIYSYGIFLWELVTLQQPFSDVFPPFLVMNEVMEGRVY